jgi:hypothetical protein
MDNDYNISLDCAPGCTRPDSLLPLTLKDTLLNEKDFMLVSTCFGEWVFTLSNDKKDLYVKCQAQIEANIEQLYEAGRIRYGSWTKI